MSYRNGLLCLLVTVLVGMAGFIGYQTGISATHGKPADDLTKELTTIKTALADTRADLAAMRNRLEAAEKQPLPVQLVKRSDALYQGKPASHWLEVLKDRDQDTTILAMRALATIAEVDHSMIPAVISGLEGLRTDEKFKDGQTYLARGEEILDYLLTRTRLDAKEKAALIPHLIRAVKARPDLLPNADYEADALNWDQRHDSKPLQFAFNFFDLIVEDQQSPAPLLMSMLTDKEPCIRAIGIRVAYDVGKDDSIQVPVFRNKLIPQLKSALTHKDGRFAAACALAYLAGPNAEEAIPILTQKGKINANSLAALKAIGPKAKAAIPALIAYVGSDDATSSRTEVVDFLADFGPDAKEAIPALVKLLAKLEPPSTEKKAPVPSVGPPVPPLAFSPPPVPFNPIEENQKYEIEHIRKALKKLGHKNKLP